MIDQEKVFIYHTQEGEFNFNYRATIALREKEGGYRVGISICSPYDWFVKKRGVKSAVGRSRSEHESIFISSNSRNDILDSVKSSIELVTSRKEMKRSHIKMGEADIQHMEEVSNNDDMPHLKARLKELKEELRNTDVLGEVQTKVQESFKQKETAE